MTFEIGDRVVYVPWEGATPESGVVTATHNQHAFVRFDGDTGSKATPYDLLTEETS